MFNDDLTELIMASSPAGSGDEISASRDQDPAPRTLHLSMPVGYRARKSRDIVILRNFNLILRDVQSSQLGATDRNGKGPADVTRNTCELSQSLPEKWLEVDSAEKSPY
jgi:hypothetical protein